MNRGKHPKDRRCYLIRLSSEGASLYQRASRQMDQLDKEFLSPLNSHEQKTLKILLAKLFSQLTEQGISPQAYKDPHAP